MNRAAGRRERATRDRGGAGARPRRPARGGAGRGAAAVAREGARGAETAVGATPAKSSS